MAKLVNLLSTSILSLSLIACGGGDGATPSPNPAPNPPTLPQPVESISDVLNEQIQQLKSGDDSALAILVRRDGNIVYEYAEGTAREDVGLAASSMTAFNLASVSKPFTAVAILQLQEQMELNLSDSIRDYLPELPTSWGDIRIDQLLSHQSGIYDFLNDRAALNYDPELVEGLNNQDLIEYFIANPDLEFEPGSRAEYSNTGYVLLAEIVERVSMMSFADYMDAFIYQPTGMTYSFVQEDASFLNEDYALNWGVQEQVYGYHFYTTGSDSQFSAAADFDGFLDALLNFELVSQESLTLMTELHSPEISYGYGIGVSNLDSENEVWRHTGELDGYRSLLAIYPNQDLQVVILGNGGPVTVDVYQNIELAAFDFYSGSSRQLFGSGNRVSQTRELEPFDKVVVELGNVEINDCDTQIMLTFDDNLISSVTTFVEDNTLTLGFNGNFNADESLDAVICSRELSQLEVSGVSSAVVNLETTAELISHQGTGAMQLKNVNGTNSQFVLNGIGSMTVSGVADSNRLLVSGTSTFNGLELVTGSTDINKTGTGTATLSTNTLTGVIGGIGNVLVNNSAIVDVTTFGLAGVVLEAR